MPNNEALSDMRLVDVVISATSDRHNAPIGMGGKFYDYVASGVPIWFIVPSNAESKLEFAKKSGKPFVSDIFDLTSIESELEKIISLWEDGGLSKHGCTKSEASPYSRKNQYKKILPLLK